MRRRPNRAHTVGIVGLGLVGGSLAKALRARFPKRPLIGIDPDAKTQSLAGKNGIFDALLAGPSANLADCEIVVLCAPVAAIEELLELVSREMRDGAILTDVGGVKEPIVKAARLKVRRPIAFVGAHPMFGGEKGGYAAAQPDRWKGGTVAVCTDGGNERAIQKVVDLHRGLGAQVILCTAAEHDEAVASVSHLPYILASALALTVEQAPPLARKLAGRGLADMIRPAGFSYEVQGAAARLNRYVPPAAEALAENLGRLRGAIADSPEAARAAFSRARKAKESLP